MALSLHDYDLGHRLPWLNPALAAFIGGACVHIALVLPERRKWVRERPWLAYAPYIPAVALAVLVVMGDRPVGYAVDRANLDRHFALAATTAAFQVACFLVFACGIAWATVRASTPQARLQAKVALAGLLMAFTPTVLISIPIALGKMSEVSLLLTDLSILFWIIWPLSISYAIYKHRMFDIDVALRRAMVYVLLVSALTLLYVGTLLAVGRIVEWLFGTPGNIAANAVATGVIAVLFEPLRARARTMVDRLFFRQDFDFQAVVTGFGDRARAARDVAGLVEDFARTIDAALHPEYLVVLVRPEPSDELVQATAIGMRPVTLSLEAGGPIVIPRSRLSSVEDGVLATGVLRLDGLEDACFLPFYQDEDLLGGLVLGPRKSGAEYLERDRALLRALGQHLAVWLKNGQLFEQLARRAQELEDIVKLYEKAHQEALSDPLTGLNNRRAFQEFAGKAISAARRGNTPLAVILLDIDHFKRFNDTYGHATGDRAIGLVARVLADCVRESDFPARWGGEEFIVCLPGAALHQAILVAERIRREAPRRNLVADDGQPVPHVTLSLGVASLSPQDDLETLVARADQALYVAKAKGRNLVQTLDREVSPGHEVRATTMIKT